MTLCQLFIGVEGFLDQMSKVKCIFNVLRNIFWCKPVKIFHIFQDHDASVVGAGQLGLQDRIYLYRQILGTIFSTIRLYGIYVVAIPTAPPPQKYASPFPCYCMVKALYALLMSVPPPKCTAKGQPAKTSTQPTVRKAIFSFYSHAKQSAHALIHDHLKCNQKFYVKMRIIFFIL